MGYSLIETFEQNNGLSVCIFTSQGGYSLLTEDQDADAFVRIFLFSSPDNEKHSLEE